jgi:hypothetical protein
MTRGLGSFCGVVVKTKKSPDPRRAARRENAECTQVHSSGGQNEPQKRFVNDLVTRGDAAEPNAQGKLPLNATYAIVEKNPDGSVKTVKAVRKKLF